jgi:glycerophosphoryl diester phosphodiesterase
LPGGFDLFGWRLIAHRGLHDESAGVIENSLSAFKAAVASGYAIETDVRPARRSEPVIFHDSMLDRLTRLTGPVRNQPASLLSQCRLAGTPDIVLTLDAFLDAVNKRVPVFLEVKSEGRTDLLFLRNILRSLIRYRGPLAIMSFDSSVPAFFRRALPRLPRGLGVERHSLPSWIGESGLPAKISMARPHFLAVEKSALHDPVVQRMVWRDRLPLAAWTIKSQHEASLALRHAGAVIFEGFQPGGPARIYRA